MDLGQSPAGPFASCHRAFMASRSRSAGSGGAGLGSSAGAAGSEPGRVLAGSSLTTSTLVATTGAAHRPSGPIADGSHVRALLP